MQGLNRTLHNAETGWASDDVSWPYGAFLMNRYTRWEPANHVLTLYYLMSTSRPYQVQVMKSQIRTDIIGGPPGRL